MDNLIKTILDDRTLPSGYYKMLLITMVLNGTEKVSQKELMQQCSIGSRNTLVKTAKYLENAGWLKITHNRTENMQFDINDYEVHYAK